MIIANVDLLCVVACTNTVGETEVLGYIKGRKELTVHVEDQNSHNLGLEYYNTRFGVDTHAPW